MGPFIDDLSRDGKESAFLCLYRHMERLERAANSLVDEMRPVSEQHDEPFTPDYDQILLYARRGTGEIHMLGMYADRLAEPEREQFFGHFERIESYYDQVIQACRARDLANLKYLFDYVEGDADWIAIESEVLAVAAFGQWGAYFFYFAAESLPDEFRGRCTAAGLTELIRASRFGMEDNPVVVTPLQERILAALHGRALKKEPLADEVCKGQGRTLYKPGGIKELQEKGLVAHLHTVGYYRPDSPPPNAVPPGRPLGP